MLMKTKLEEAIVYCNSPRCGYKLQALNMHTDDDYYRKAKHADLVKCYHPYFKAFRTRGTFYKQNILPDAVPFGKPAEFSSNRSPVPPAGDGNG